MSRLNYILVIFLQASSGEELYQTVGKTVSLKPFMYYAVTVQACTAGGCTTSPPTIVRTGTSKPSGQEPLRVLDVNSTAVRLAWNHPSNPNGQIRRCSFLSPRKLCLWWVYCFHVSRPCESLSVTFCFLNILSHCWIFIRSYMQDKYFKQKSKG